jgi:tRNA threonylcarbamoyladenosine biosynthesis protein TsaB
MNTLGIDTATGFLGVIAAKNGQTAMVSTSAGLTHGESLFPWLERIMEVAGMNPRDLELVVCALGPGSFTGLRIGLAAAKALALSAGCPLAGVPSLDVFGVRNAFFSGTVVPVIDARKGRFYAACYREGRRTGEYLDIPPAGLRSLLDNEKKVLLTGPDAAKIYTPQSSVPRAHITLFPSAQELPSLLDVGIQSFREKGPLPDGTGPVYVRPSEAEAKRVEKNRQVPE